jgi:hypothetical protein
VSSSLNNDLIAVVIILVISAFLYMRLGKKSFKDLVDDVKGLFGGA